MAWPLSPEQGHQRHFDAPPDGRLPVIELDSDAGDVLGVTHAANLTDCAFRLHGGRSPSWCARDDETHEAAQPEHAVFCRRVIDAATLGITATVLWLTLDMVDQILAL
jgi:hypothetical protein